MKEFLYHALGLCAEHSHPHLLHLIIGLTIALIASIVLYKKVK